MPLCTVPALRYAPGIRLKSRFLLHSFSHCALETEESGEETSSNDCNYLELMRRMTRYASSGDFNKALHSLDSVKNVLPGKPTVMDYNNLIYSYIKSDCPSLPLLVEVYAKMMTLGPTPNVHTFNILLNGMLNLRAFREALSVAKDMCDSGFVPSFTFLSTMLRKSLGSSSLCDCLSVFELMMELDYVPTQPTLNLLNSSLCKAGMIQEACLMVSFLLDKNRLRGGYSYNPIIWALCKSGQSYTALRLFYLMKMKGITHNISAYTALIYGFGQEGLETDIFHCLKVMELDGCKPNVITYTVTIKFFCNYGWIDKALSTLLAMEKEGCDPDLLTYNIILRELCHRDRVDDAVKLLHEMGLKGLSPDPFSFASLGGGLLKVGKVNSASILLGEVISKGCKDVAVCNLYFHCLCLQHRSRVALVELENMRKNGILPTNVSYNTVLQGFCTEGHTDEALELLKGFDWEVTGPDVCSFNIILNAACKQQDTSMIRRILDLMECKGIKLDVVGLTCFIQYFCTVGKFSEFELLEILNQFGAIPNTVTLNVLLQKLCESNLLQRARTLLFAFRDSGISPDLISYNILIHGCIKEKNQLLLGEVIRNMNSLRLNPDAYTMASLILGLCNEGKISIAMRLRSHMLEEYGLKPTTVIYNIILEALFRRGKFWDIISLRKFMIMDECEPDEITKEIYDRAVSKCWLKKMPKVAKLLESVVGR
ncbi:uncharacterized protein [Rutidosis leptorrhynchoides]|uniref:uncharacterized protein n=1 Tax=Rutidosis leptorrhynchoides TaxID=125765 RepID=UPI003A98FDAB